MLSGSCSGRRPQKCTFGVLVGQELRAGSVHGLARLSRMHRASDAAQMRIKAGAPAAPPVAKPVWVGQIVTVAADREGIFHPAVDRDAHVVKGAKIGSVTDYLNRPLQDVLAPESVAANVFRFAVPAGRVTHSFRWEPGRVSFRTVRLGGRSRRDDRVAERLFTVRVPTAGAENPHIVLLYVRGSPKPPSKDVEVVVEKFAFLP